MPKCKQPMLDGYRKLVRSYTDDDLRQGYANTLTNPYRDRKDWKMFHIACRQELHRRGLGT